MDFQGQRLAERVCLYVVLVFAVLGFSVGFLTSNFELMMMIYFAGVLFAFLLVGPDWPWFNRNPLNWLPPLYEKGHKRDKSKDKGKGDSKRGSTEGSKKKR